MQGDYNLQRVKKAQSAMANDRSADQILASCTKYLSKQKGTIMTTQPEPLLPEVESHVEKAIEILSRIDFQEDRMKKIRYIATELATAVQKERERFLKSILKRLNLLRINIE